MSTRDVGRKPVGRSSSSSSDVKVEMSGA